MAKKKKAKPKSRKQKRRQEIPPDFWKAGKATSNIGDEEFRAICFRRVGESDDIILDDILEEVSWEDSGAALKGTLRIRRPDQARRGHYGTVGIRVGHRVGLYYRRAWGRGWEDRGGGWNLVWVMRVNTPQKDIVDGTIEYELSDEIDWMSKSKDSFKYRKKKRGKYKKGWRADQITASVLRKYKIRKGTLTRAKHRIQNLSKEKASPYDMIVAAWRAERRHTGRRFFIRMDKGRLSVTPLRYSRVLYELGDLVTSATLSETTQPDFATALTVRHTVTKKGKGGKKGRKKKKIVTTYKDRNAIANYGYIHDYIDGEATSRAAARREAKRSLRDRFQPKREVTLTHPGVVDVRRGQACRLYFPKEELKQVVFVKEVRHTVSPGSFEMELTLGFDDPYKDYREAEALRKKCAAARKRRRKIPSECPAEYKAKKKKSSKSRRRGNREPSARAPIRGLPDYGRLRGPNGEDLGVG